METEDLGSQAVSDGGLGLQGNIAILELPGLSLEPIVNPPRAILGGPSFFLIFANPSESLGRDGIRASRLRSGLGLQSSSFLVLGLDIMPRGHYEWPNLSQLRHFLTGGSLMS